MTTVVPKAIQIAHRTSCYIGNYAIFGVSGYEVYNNPPISFDEVPFGGGPGWMHEFRDISSNNYLNNNDLRLVSATAQGMGWTFTFEARGKSAEYSQYSGSRSIGANLFEYKNGGLGQWNCYSSGAVVASIILKRNGVSSQIGPNGEDILVINSATPDAFLDELSLPSMPYLHSKAVQEERKRWQDLINDAKDAANKAGGGDDAYATALQAQLGYSIQGTGQGGIADQVYVDPFSGFANYRDQYSLTVGQLMELVPCNNNHVLVHSSAIHGLMEILDHHVFCNGRRLTDFFALDWHVEDNPENQVLSFELSGTPNSIIKTAASNGNYRAWWDSKSTFHFLSDYSNRPIGQIPIAAVINVGPSMIGNLKVSVGSPTVARINRVAVRGQPFSSFSDAETNALDSYYSKVMGSVYPTGQQQVGFGTDITQENYLGMNAGEQARRVYHAETAETTFSWENFPYPSLAMGLFNRVIAINGKDPKGAWDFTGSNDSSFSNPAFTNSGSGKLFVVTNVSVSLTGRNDPASGYYMCSISGLEIIAR